MNEGKLVIVAVIALIGFVLFSSSVFTVQENQQVLVMHWNSVFLSPKSIQIILHVLRAPLAS